MQVQETLSAPHSPQSSSTAVISPPHPTPQNKELYHLFVLYVRKLEPKEVKRLTPGNKPSDLELGIMTQE